MIKKKQYEHKVQYFERVNKILLKEGKSKEQAKELTEEYWENIINYRVLDDKFIYKSF